MMMMVPRRLNRSDMSPAVSAAAFKVRTPLTAGFRGRIGGRRDYGYFVGGAAGFKSPCNSFGSGRLEHFK